MGVAFVKVFLSALVIHPLTWMCCNLCCNNIDWLYERCLQIIYSDKAINFNQPIEKDDLVSIYNQNIQQLAINLSIYINFNQLSHEIIKGIFQFRDEIPCNLRQISVSYPLWAYNLMIHKLLNFLHQKYGDLDLMK